MKNILRLFIFLFLPLSSVTQADSLKVVASIKPIHSIVSFIMKGVGNPTLLIKGISSPHEYNLRASDAMILENADVVFWLGKGMESFLVKPLNSLKKNSIIVTISDYQDLHRIKFYDNFHHNGGNQVYDLHLWLSPYNAKYIAHVIAMEMIKIDPKNKDIYEKNEEEFKSKLYKMDEEFHDILRQVKGKNIIVFHDAYRYFASYYDLHIVTFPMRHSIFMGAKSLQKVKDNIVLDKTSCIFYDPGFDPKIINYMTEGTGIKSAMLDPEGILLAEGSDLYFQLMNNISNSIAEKCIY
ncbi:zinc ABC transporter substrate-binding protein [Candidatus Liberibacter brunswickensis]|uniref:zinc ABC transporter substrate-binding protein n=1 Tax=Candidatus Liberibacter brunswickensis TaxID=1968796 RepID=UPI002FE08656